MTKYFLYATSLLVLCGCGNSNSKAELQSPNGKIKVVMLENSQVPAFNIIYDNTSVMDSVTLGLTTNQRVLAHGMRLVDASKSRGVHDEYDMVSGKRSHCVNDANQKTFIFANDDNDTLQVCVRAYDDGCAYRYIFTANSGEEIMAENGEYPIADGKKRWIQTYDPGSYERFFPLATNGDNLDKYRPNQWGYPALFEASDSVFVLISEAEISRGHYASYLDNSDDSQRYAVAIGDQSMPVAGEWVSPWRVAIIGKLSDIVESTLITDLSSPSVIEDTSWIEPAPVSWVYWAYNHGSNDYEIVKKYVDLAVEMGWPYVLIDAEWDEMGNGGTIEDALAYAREKGVKPMVWYNSTTGWIEGAPGPKYRLNDPEKREAEFAWLNKMGVAGIKIDFFYGDGHETMDYYLDLLESAMNHNLLVTFHGATIPRGWQRTYPNMMTVEAVYGAEWYNNNPVLTDRAAAHNATLPFTRNVIGPMDYTPGTFTDSQHPHITSHGHELALPFLFESPLQHMPDRPDGYLTLPEGVKSLLSSLPTAWDDTRLLGGYPGGEVVIARRKGDTWYVAGINGKDKGTTLFVDLSPLNAVGKELTLYQDGKSQLEFGPIETMNVNSNPLEVVCLPRGGFVAVIK